MYLVVKLKYTEVKYTEIHVFDYEHSFEAHSVSDTLCDRLVQKLTARVQRVWTN